MTSYDYSDLGDRIKHYEMVGLSRTYLLPGEHIIARLDGRAFSKFTKRMDRPYDISMSTAMTELTESLIKEFGAHIGYTQSDEITLVWNTDVRDQLMFGGRVSKWLSLLSAHASVHFNHIIEKHKPGYVAGCENLPTLDTRIFTVPSKSEVVNALIWRQEDATKNAISMAAHSMFKQSEVHGKNGAQMQEMLFATYGINFNDYPTFFKRGTFLQRTYVEELMDDKTYFAIPEHVRGTVNRKVLRSKVLPFDCWITRVGGQENITNPDVDIQAMRFDALFNRSAKQGIA